MIFWCTSLPWWHHLNKPTSLCPLPSPLARRQDQERVRKRAVSGSERDERMRLTCRTKSIYSLSSCNYSLSSLLEMNIYCSNVRQANLNKSVMGISSLFQCPTYKFSNYEGFFSQPTVHSSSHQKEIPWAIYLLQPLAISLTFSFLSSLAPPLCHVPLLSLRHNPPIRPYPAPGAQSTVVPATSALKLPTAILRQSDGVDPSACLSYTLITSTTMSPFSHGLPS